MFVFGLVGVGFVQASDLELLGCTSVGEERRFPLASDPLVRRWLLAPVGEIHPGAAPEPQVDDEHRVRGNCRCRPRGKRFSF